MSPVIEFFLQVRTSNPNNGPRGNSRIVMIMRAKEDSERRSAARNGTREAMRLAGLRPPDLVPCVVTLTRLSSGHLDKHDALGPSQKRIADGIAEALGIDDGGPFVDWEYRQQKVKPGVFGTFARIERRHP